MKIESLSLNDIKEVCRTCGIDVRNKRKLQLIEKYYEYEAEEIRVLKEEGRGYEFIKNKILEISNEYSEKLKDKIENRTEEMQSDNNSHYLIYNVLGISNEDGQKIDLYQNTGRFLYKYAGAFLEEITVLCFKYHDLDSKRTLVDNTIGQRPKTFEIDCLSETNAYEIKWRDATTDGDHITKEHTRVRAIKSHNYTPIRIMFYYPNREQAQRIQEALRAIYTSPEISGEYYGGEEAWDYVKNTTSIDLKQILTKIVEERNSNNE